VDDDPSPSSSFPQQLLHHRTPATTTLPSSPWRHHRPGGEWRNHTPPPRRQPTATNTPAIIAATHPTPSTDAPPAHTHPTPCAQQSPHERRRPTVGAPVPLSRSRPAPRGFITGRTDGNTDHIDHYVRHRLRSPPPASTAADTVTVNHRQRRRHRSARHVTASDPTTPTSDHPPTDHIVAPRLATTRPHTRTRV
jgi:hypothetical protein